MTVPPSPPADRARPTGRPFARWRVRLQRMFGLRMCCAHTYYSALLAPSSVVVDLGAHHGEFSKGLSEVHGCRCLAVEADPALAARLRASGVETLNAAIAASDGETQLFLTGDGTHNSIVASPSGSRAITVASRAFDTIAKQFDLQHIELLKVDIEGSEIALLSTTSDELLRRIAQVCVEFHPHITGTPAIAAAMQRMATFGFIVIDVGGPPHYSDVLFINWRRLLALRHLPALCFFVVLRSYLAGRRPRRA